MPTSLPSRRRLGATALAIALLALLAAVMAPAAGARTAYVAGYYDDVVYVVDATTGQQVAPPIATGTNSGPYTLAIAPDGKTVWVLNYSSGTLISIDTATNQVVGAPITVPEESYNVAITPDGTRAYLASYSTDSLIAVDLQTRQVIGSPIPTGEGADGVSIAPDGSRVYVSNYTDGTVSVVDTATNQVTGGPITLGGRPYYSAITPDGRTLLVADTKESIRTLDTATGVPGPIFKVGEEPTSVAISPDGKRAYSVNYESDNLSAIDLAAGQVLQPPIAVGNEPEFAAVTPDGAHLLVSTWSPAQVFSIDTASLTVSGAPASIGKGSGTVAIVPDQSPAASFSHKRARPGVPVGFDGAASSDPDGTVASFAWNFGDGQGASTPTATVSHAYAKPGKYTATLTVTDNEGCSAALVFTGQTASCHGSPGAVATQTVKVAYPGVKVRCPRSAKASCRFKVKAVAKKGKGRLKSLSAVAKGKAKPGKSARLSLKPKKAFAKKLAKAKKTLVQLSVTVGGETKVKLKKLKIVS
jgi:YVTN family beta-propeller protein